MSFLILVALMLGFAVVPVMIGARVVGARNRGFRSALLAVIVLTAILLGIDNAIGNQPFVFLVSACAGGFVLAGILGTSFWRGIGVSIIAVAVQYFVVLVVAGVLVGGTAATR